MTQAETMADKVCLVTGSTSGIGIATALALAREGAMVLLVGRSRARGAAALDRIRAETGRTDARFFSVDLSIQAEVRTLAREVQGVFPRLDVLINNAGAFFHHRRESADGFEMTWALNVLSPFLLTRLLQDTLTASAPARVLFLSSFVHRWGRVHFDDLQGQPRYNRVRAYSQSKAAAVMLSNEFARRLAGRGVTVNALDPGFVSTGIISGNGGRPWRLFELLASLVAITPAESARTSLYLASSPDVAAATGRYFRRGNPVIASSVDGGVAAAGRLWQVCLEMTGETATP
jgi:NAD(P)-dependent dehydrogenase (short-subunit alcohol dehydrogenase family)